MIRRIRLSFIVLVALLGLSTYANAESLLVTNFTSNASISRFSLTGQYLGVFATGLYYPTGMTLGPDGDVWVADGGAINRYTDSGAFLGEFASLSYSPRGLAFDRKGNLYVADFFNSKIHKYSPTGVDLGVFATTGLSFPRGLVFDGAGNLYASNAIGVGSLANTLRKFSASGADKGNYAQAPALSFPFGLAFDASGNLYVANDGNGTVRKFSANGNDLGDFATGLGGASGLTFDSSGDLYVATNVRNTIRKFSPTGTDLGTFTNPELTTPKFLAIIPAAVPEPGSLALLTGVLVTISGLLLRRHRTYQ